MLDALVPHQVELDLVRASELLVLDMTSWFQAFFLTSVLLNENRIRFNENRIRFNESRIRFRKPDPFLEVF